MRIISGKYKKANLTTVKNRKTRPTTDYLKEVIFSVLCDCEGDNVLDLYAGSGSLGLEALSRGAYKATFVDISEGAIKAIRANTKKLKCEADCTIFKKKVSAFIKSNTTDFDMIFIDPPYNKNLINATIELIFMNNFLIRNGRIVIERSKDENLDEKWQKYVTFDKKYSTSAVTILVLEDEEKQNEII